MATKRSFAQGPEVDTVAGNGILHRRMFLMAGTAVAACCQYRSAWFGGRRSFAGRALDEASGVGIRRLRPTVEIRREGC